MKLTGLGLGLGEDLCRANLEAVVRDARERSTYVRIDMEDSSTTDATLALYRDLRAAGYENLGVVLQSRLRRTLADTAGLDDVRLCKGIYIEPEAIAFQGYDEVRASYVQCLEALVDAGAYVGIATHDEFLLGEALRLVRERGLRETSTSSRCCLGSGLNVVTSSSATATASASTSRLARSGTSTHCGGCRRILRSRGMSQRTSHAAFLLLVKRMPLEPCPLEQVDEDAHGRW